MYFYAHSRGTVFIAMGSLLLLVIAGDLIFKLLCALLGLHLINYGLRLKGMSSMHSIICSWLDTLQW